MKSQAYLAVKGNLLPLEDASQTLELSYFAKPTAAESAAHAEQDRLLAPCRKIAAKIRPVASASGTIGYAE